MAKKEENPLLKQALEYHEKGINVAKTFYKGKSPPKGGQWKAYKTERVTEAQLQEWFGGGRWCNMAAVTGPVSRGLTVLDFDSKTAYHKWSEKFPESAKKLPTSSSGRGFHVWFRSKLDADDTQSFAGIDIKAGGLATLPPSTHENGRKYEWLTPLPDRVEDLPVLDPYDFKLEQFTDGKDGKEGIEGRDGEGSKGGRGGVCSYQGLNGLIVRKIDAAIQKTLPTGYGQSYDLLFLLARTLKAIKELENKSVAEIMALGIIEEWYNRALPNLKTKSLILKKARFDNAWRDAKHPVGKGVSLMVAWRQAQKSTLQMQEFEWFHNDELVKRVIRLCFELQKLAGPNDVWFLPTNKAPELFGISHSWLAVLLQELAAREVIEKVKEHTRQKCARYIYIGPSKKFLKI
ncbi:MAG TPA: bifunctional DNA primase/polymerase [Planctomycetes bacterium]|nr:bifunctional DNA primase/polymerase [Planctomycetota bacterium]